MRRFLLLLAAVATLVVVLGVVGCGDGDDDEATPTPGAAGETMTLADIAEAIRGGDIDVGTVDGMGLEERYHTIHSVTVLGLDCTLCHKPPAGVTEEVLGAQDKSPQSPTTVDVMLCASCHSAGGPAQTLYE